MTGWDDGQQKNDHLTDLRGTKKNFFFVIVFCTLKKLGGALDALL